MVIIVSGCLILTAVNLIILIEMGNITDQLVLSCARSIMTFDITLHEVCVRVVGRAYATSQPNFLGWIVYQILLPMVVRCTRFEV